LLLLAVALATRNAHAASAPAEDPAAVLFTQRCSTCHNIGGGDKVGPDLLGVTGRRDKAWAARFVRTPGAVIDAGDPVAQELLARANGVRMPDQALTDEEFEALWGYFARCTDKGGCAPVPVGPRWGTDATAEEIALGKALFFGAQRLRRGGPPCFACHDLRPGETPLAGGGSLGPDLTFAYARLGEKGLEPQLGQLGTPVMKAVYGGAPFEDEERYALKAYLADLSRDGTPPRPRREFLWLGLEGMGIVLAALTLAWARPGRRGPPAPAPQTDGPQTDESKPDARTPEDRP
jgi:mono/diheme cytochrome c family protein